jgi:hypothetical protein
MQVAGSVRFGQLSFLILISIRITPFNASFFALYLIATIAKNTLANSFFFFK